MPKALPIDFTGMSGGLGPVLGQMARQVMATNLNAGKGVVSGLGISPGDGLQIRVQPGSFTAQLEDSVDLAFSVAVKPNYDGYLWIETNDIPGDQPNTLIQATDADPGSTYVCLGHFTSDSATLTTDDAGRKAFGWKLGNPGDVESQVVAAVQAHGLAKISDVQTYGGEVLEEATTAAENIMAANGSTFSIDANGDLIRTRNGVSTDVGHVRGERGAAFWGDFASLTLFPKASDGVNPGDTAYNAYNYSLYVWRNGGWNNMGSLRGTDGITPALSVTVIGLPAGSSPTVVRGGTDAAPTIALGIPVGAQGPQGSQGIQGVSGVVAATAPLTYDATSKTVAIPAASSTQDGYMPKAQVTTISGHTTDIAALKAKTVTTSCGLLISGLSLTLGGGTGTLTIPFGKPMPDTNYDADYSISGGAGVSLASMSVTTVEKLTTGLRLTMKNTGTVALNLTLTIIANAVRYA